MIIGIKQLTIDEIDQDRPRSVNSDEELCEEVDQDVQTLRKSDMPSMAAMAKLEDFCASYHTFMRYSLTIFLSMFTVIPYTAPWHSEAATRNPHLKLLWDLLGFAVIYKGSRFLYIGDRSLMNVLLCRGGRIPMDVSRFQDARGT
jgi:hypothetical protein